MRRWWKLKEKKDPCRKTVCSLKVWGFKVYKTINNKRQTINPIPSVFLRYES